MRFILIAILVLFFASAFGQPLQDRATIIAHIMNPENPGKLRYDPPTATGKGKFGTFLYKPAWFFQYDSASIEESLMAINTLITCFIFKDSIAYFDQPVFAVCKNSMYDGKARFMDASVLNVKWQLWERATILTDVMPLMAFMSFPDVGKKKRDAVLTMYDAANDWEFNKDIHQMDWYAEWLAYVIYDFVLKEDKKHFRKIIINTLSQAGGVIHTVSFELDKYEGYDSLLKKFSWPNNGY